VRETKLRVELAIDVEKWIEDTLTVVLVGILVNLNWAGACLGHTAFCRPVRILLASVTPAYTAVFQASQLNVWLADTGWQRPADGNIATSHACLLRKRYGMDLGQLDVDKAGIMVEGVGVKSRTRDFTDTSPRYNVSLISTCRSSRISLKLTWQVHKPSRRKNTSSDNLTASGVLASFLCWNATFADFLLGVLLPCGSILSFGERSLVGREPNTVRVPVLGTVRGHHSRPPTPRVA
jgi:hypothetical protein